MRSGFFPGCINYGGSIFPGWVSLFRSGLIVFGGKSMDDLSSSNEYVIKNRPLGAWVGTAFLILASIYFLFTDFSMILYALFFLGIALLLLILSPMSTAIADRALQTITITSKSLFRREETVIPFRDVANIDIETSHTHTSTRNQSTNYRLVLVKSNGERVPIQQTYTSFYDGKARQAKALSQFLNLPGWEDKPTNLFQTALQGQAVMTENPAMAQEGTTSGVTWKVEVHFVGGKPVTRWLSADYTSYGNFLLVAQKPANSKTTFSGGFLGNLMTMVYQQLLGMYGFLPADTPGYNNAKPVVTRDARFEQNFSTLTSEQHFGLTVLNPWTLTPFVQWAEKYPLKALNTSDQVGQLAVLFSPRGLQVAVLGSLPATETDEIIALGVELVRAQGGGQPTA
jgi:hypothetical protein